MIVLPHRRKAFRPAGGDDEFDIVGATYFAVAPSGYSYTAEQDTNYSTRKYTTLSAAEAGLSTSPSTPQVINIIGDWTSASDTTAVTFDGGTYSATNYVLVRVLNVQGDTARHSGIWDSSRYVLSVSGAAIDVNDSDVRLDGLQVEETHGGSRDAIKIQEPRCRIEHCIIRTNANGASNQCINMVGTGTTLKMSNCITISNNGTAVQMSSGPAAGMEAWFYNCTFYGYGGGTGLILEASPTTHEPIFKNCIIDNFTTTASGDVHDDSDYCATDNASFGWTQTTGGSNHITSATLAFVDAANDDLHLAAGATSAIDGGTDLSSDADYPISDDIDYATRSGSWDIGADER